MANRKTNDSDLLARLDERTQNFARTLDSMASENRELSNKMLAALEKHIGDDDTRFDKHDTRLKVLENWRWYIVGTVAVASFFAWLFFQVYKFH